MLRWTCAVVCAFRGGSPYIGSDASVFAGSRVSVMVDSACVNLCGLSLQVRLYESHSKAMMKDQTGLEMEELEGSSKPGLSHIFQVSHFNSSFMCWGIVSSCACLVLRT